MNKFIQIYSLILGLSMLDIVTCSNKLKSSLSFLDHTLDEGGLTNCDLAFQGGNIILDEGHDGRAVISGQTSVLWTAKVELSDNSGLFQSGLCQSQPVLLCKESVKMQTKTG